MHYLVMSLGGDGFLELTVVAHTYASGLGARQQAVVIALSSTQSVARCVEGYSGYYDELKHVGIYIESAWLHDAECALLHGFATITAHHQVVAYHYGQIYFLAQLHPTIYHLVASQLVGQRVVEQYMLGLGKDRGYLYMLPHGTALGLLLLRGEGGFCLSHLATQGCFVYCHILYGFFGVITAGELPLQPRAMQGMPRHS